MWLIRVWSTALFVIHDGLLHQLAYLLSIEIFYLFFFFKCVSLHFISLLVSPLRLSGQLADP